MGRESENIVAEAKQPPSPRVPAIPQKVATQTNAEEPWESTPRHVIDGAARCHRR